jgi:hypothetical protein
MVGEAFVSGPRTVMVVPPFNLVMTISQWLTAIELKAPVLVTSLCQILLTKGESDGLSCQSKSIFLPPRHQVQPLEMFYPTIADVRNQLQIPSPLA